MADHDRIGYRLESTALNGASPELQRLRARESLNQPYAADVLVSVPQRDFDFGAMLGQDIAITMLRSGVERRMAGLVYSVTELGSGVEGTSARIVVSPALQLLGLRRNTRMFQEKTVPEILEAVLGEALGPHGRAARLELTATYDPREYCLQYQESDLDFVHRLAEEEGIAYFFDHAGDVEELVMVDANTGCPHATTVRGEGTVAFDRLFASGHADTIHRFDIGVQHVTTAVTVRDFDWTQGTLPVMEEASGEDALGRVRESYEHGSGRQLQIGSYDEGVRRYQKNDAARQAPLRREGAAAPGTVAHGGGRAVGLAPGHRIRLIGYPSVGVDGEYLVTRVQHTSRAPEGDPTTEPYHNEFECIPFATPFRPARTTPKPIIHGMQTAIVTGPAGEEIHVDEHGRIKVQFHWDRENPADETSSCWVRVKQEWAGAGWGFWWVPRIGMEVVVHFVDGDPDRPLVTGSVYDGANPTPYPLPDEKTKSTIKSNSSLGGGGFNEFRFEDKAGSEEIFTHAQKDYNEVIENDHTTTVHHDQSNTVDNNQTQTIGANQTERVDVDQTMTVVANRTVHVKGNFDETVDGTETRHTAGDVTESFGANEARSVGGNLDETIGANETRTLGASQSETIGGSQTLTIGADSSVTVSGAMSTTVTGGITTTTPASFDATAAAGWTVTADGGITLIAPGGAQFLVPGGVQRVDNLWEILAGEHKQSGTFQIELFVVKIGLTGFGGELVLGAKLDFCTSDTSTSAVKLRQEATKARLEAIANETGGPDAEANATDVSA